MLLSIATLSLIASALAAPVVVTQTDVVYVTAGADATTASSVPAYSASHAPALGHVLEVVVSELQIVEGDSTATEITTFTQTLDVAVSSAAAPAAATTSSYVAPATPTLSVVDALVAAETSTSSTEAAPTTTSSSTTSTPTTEAQTTTLAPTTSSEDATTSTSTTSEAAATTSSSSSTDSDFATAILNEHNAKRALHGVPDLTWSSTLEAYAQAYADEYDCSGNLVHSGGEYGENLGLGYTTTGVVDAWYNEISDYDWSNPSASHFTQVVWKSTTELGCAAVQCGSYWGQYTICSYNPAGNYAGEYADNVLPLV